MCFFLKNCSNEIRIRREPSVIEVHMVRQPHGPLEKVKRHIWYKVHFQKLGYWEKMPLLYCVL